VFLASTFFGATNNKVTPITEDVTIQVRNSIS